MKLRVYKDDRGIAHLALVLALVLVLAVGGVGYYVYSKDKKDKDLTGTTAANSEIENTCKELYDDKDLCKFSASYSGKGPYKATYAMTDKDGQTSTMIMELDSKGNSSTVTKDGDTEVAAFISLDGDTYIKDLTDGSWTKYPKSESDTSVSSEPTDDLKIDTTEKDKPEDQRITYKKLGKEACGNATCFKYQIIDPASTGDESIIWFGDKDYQLRKWSFKSGEDGSTSVGEFEYTSVTISAPSPVKDAPSVPSAAELQNLLDQAQ